MLVSKPTIGLGKTPTQVVFGPTARSKCTATLREAQFGDHAQVVALETRHGLESKTYEEWIHLWTANPAYRHGWPIGWVLESADGQIVGYLGNIPLLYELNGKGLLAATGRAWVVDRAYRHYSVSLLKQFYCQKTPDLYLSTTANASSAPIYELCGSKRVPVGVWDKSAFWITEYNGFASSLLAVNMPVARSLLRYPAAVSLFLADRLRRRVRVQSCGFDVTTCSSFDYPFDDFWRKLRIERGNLLLAVRTRQVLDWHFKFALRENRLWIVTVSNALGIRACAIFMRQDVPRFGLKRLRVVDFKALQGDSGLFAPLLLWALEKCQRERIHTLENVGLPLGTDILEGIPFRVRRLPSWSNYYCATNKQLAEALSVPDVWEPSLFDGDASL